MRIDGRALAQKILKRLQRKIQTLKVKPHLAVVLVGGNPVWQTYVRQKELKAEEIGAKTTAYQLPTQTSLEELLSLLNNLNRLNKIHGVIVQRPLPAQIDKGKVALAINPQKDVDDFHPKSKFPMPVAEAVSRILREIYRFNQNSQNRSDLLFDASQPSRSKPHLSRSDLFLKWLGGKKIVVIGKGETAGGPIIAALKKVGITPQIIDRKTPKPASLTKKANIIISCVGKPEILTPQMIKKGVILIGVGIHKNNQGKLIGDYNEEKIKNIASFYTPTPGGVGPVNVACLLENLVKAAKKFKGKT